MAGKKKSLEKNAQKTKLSASKSAKSQESATETKRCDLGEENFGKGAAE